MHYRDLVMQYVCSNMKDLHFLLLEFSFKCKSSITTKFAYVKQYPPYQWKFISFTSRFSIYAVWYYLTFLPHIFIHKQVINLLQYFSFNPTCCLCQFHHTSWLMTACMEIDKAIFTSHCDDIDIVNLPCKFSFETSSIFHHHCSIIAMKRNQLYQWNQLESFRNHFMCAWMMLWVILNVILFQWRREKKPQSALHNSLRILDT